MIRSTRFTVPRTGQAPLTFEGKKLWNVVPLHENHPFLRWHEIHLYQTKGGRIVMHIALRSNNPKQGPFDDVILLAGMDDLVEALDHYDPLTGLKAFPPDPMYARRQQALEDRMNAAWSQRVAESRLLIPGGAEEIA